MMLLFELRAKVTSIYQKYDFWINLAFRFALLFIAYSRIKALLPYNATLSKTLVVLVLALVSAFLPSSLMVVVAAAYVSMQIMSKSMILAITVFALFMICYCFFLRFAPRQGSAMIAMPVMQSFGVPYALPLLMGLFSNLMSIVPVCCGVFAYYTILFVRKNIDALSQVNIVTEPMTIFTTVLDQLLKNPPMYVVMLIMTVVIVAVYFIRRINMDYAFEISIAVGTGVMMLGYIIADLKYDMGIKIAGMVVMSLISAGASLVILFFYRVLRYSAAEHVEFEDDDYYYYVKAIPKIKEGAPKRKEKKVIRRRRDGDSEDDDEEFEDTALGLIDYSNRAAESIKDAKTDASAEEEEDEDDEFGDIDDIRSFAKEHARRVAVREAENADGDAPVRAVTVAGGKSEPAQNVKPSAPAASKAVKAAPAAPAARPAAPAAKPAAPASRPVPIPLADDDDDDDEDEQVIYGYFGDAAEPKSGNADEADEDYL
ncbi:MAG: hypothetical protein IKX54_04510 [Lachnospiraceae bacterium]|nr:hypothetical protein [Lachnospiraceae bacterium]